MLRTAHDTESESHSYDMSVITIPITGETVCGDAWSAERSPGRSLYIVADGLGHGPSAAEAAEEAVRIFHLVSQFEPDRILSEIHSALARRGEPPSPSPRFFIKSRCYAMLARVISWA